MGNLEHPLKQGGQPYLVLTFDPERKLAVTMSKEKLAKYNLPTDQKEFIEYLFVGRLLKELSKKSVVDVSSDFRTLLNGGVQEELKSGEEPSAPAYVRCTYKSGNGCLFPLVKSMIFVTKPVLWIRY